MHIAHQSKPLLNHFSLPLLPKTANIKKKKVYSFNCLFCRPAISSFGRFSVAKTKMFGATLVLFLAINAYAAANKPIYSSRLIHRFSDEAQSLWVSEFKSNETTSWPVQKTFGHMRLLLGNDLKQQRLSLGAQSQPLIRSQGAQTYNYGNAMAWLHYMWIDIGTPNNSFLVALDTGSDMLWVPCDCIACAPLSLSYYNMLDKELGEYSPSHSNSSKPVSCSNELCETSSNCKAPNGHCPYTVDYLSAETSSSGYLFEDRLHLASVGVTTNRSSVKADIIIGCGNKQSGDYLNGIAPDGLMGLGPGDISVPSLLAKSGLIPHSFSFCYDMSYSGRLFFGDRGPASQNSTSFVPLKENRVAYIVEVETYCVGSSCLEQTGFKAQVDTGSSFTYLTNESYEQVVSEFDRQVNGARIATQGFEHCYKARSLDELNIPSMKLVFSQNQSFAVENPGFHIADDQGGTYCLGIERINGEISIIGQNFLMGYRIVFDWEKLKLGWSISNCQDISGEVDLTPAPNGTPQNPLPTDGQRLNPHAVAPAVAGRATTNPSEASPLIVSHYQYCIIGFTFLLWTLHK